MKAVVYERYGGPEVLQLREVEDPTPKPGQVRVRVRATSINAADYRSMRADPFLARVATGLFKPTRTPILGSDVAGVVEAVGPDVQKWQVGDEVFGDAYVDGMGALAELVCVREANLVAKPPNVSFEQAAAVPLAGVTALQGCRYHGAVKPGATVLVQGAGGGVGTFVVQVAKALGAHVVAVCGKGSVDIVRSSGADVVIDYEKEDFMARGQHYDVVLGVNGHRSLREYKRCLNPGGLYVMIGGENAQIFEALLLGWLVFLFGDKRCGTLTIDDTRRAEDLRELAQMLASGSLEPVIDCAFPLEQTAEAFRYVEGKHVRGKVVVTVA